MGNLYEFLNWWMLGRVSNQKHDCEPGMDELHSTETTYGMRESFSSLLSQGDLDSDCFIH